MHLETSASPRTPELGIDDRAQGGYSAAAVQNRSLRTPPSTSTSLASPPSLAPFPQQQLARGRNPHPSDDTVRLATQLVKRHGFQIGHYGLTAATAVRDQSVVGVASSLTNGLFLESASVAGPPISRHAHAWKPPESQGFVLAHPKSRSARKRSLEAGNHDSVLRPPAKKPRQLPPGKIDLGHIVPPRTPEDLPLPDGVSPLFFSSSSTRPYMTSQPPSFSTAEPAAAMLNRLREEQNVVRTVRLPKGQISSASPVRGYSMSTPGSAGSDSHSSRSGDSRTLPPELRDLQRLSVIDLLEADERPTFIIDLSNQANFGPGPLKLLFANASLRASQAVHELISQSPEYSTDCSRFKSWVVSFIKDNRPMDVCLPSISYGGVVWTCSTLANRFRFVSGSNAAVSITPTSPAPPARASSILEQRSRGPTPARDSHIPGRERALSDLDYFGDAEPDSNLVAARRAHSEPRDLGDLRPDTPVVPSEENLDPEPVSDLMQTFDWTRIQDPSGESISAPDSHLRPLFNLNDAH